MRCMNKERIAQKCRRAFTLIELVVVLFIISLVLVVAVPRLGALYDRQLVEEQASILEKDLLWLRSMAMSNGERASFRAGTDGYSLSVRDQNGTRKEEKTLVSARMVLETNSSSGAIIFEPRGTAFEKCTVTLSCGREARSVIVSNLGLVRVGVVE